MRDAVREVETYGRIGRQYPLPAARNSLASFEAATMGRRLLKWHAPTVSPNLALLQRLSILRDRSRHATRNDSNAKGVIEKLVSNLVGTGMKPLSRAIDVTFRREIQALWLRWTDESDADGLLDFYGQQTQAVRAWLEGGEVFVRLRARLPEDGLSVPIQLQVLEPELCPYNWNQTLPNGNRVRAGIEFSAIGKRVAYYFHPQRPGDLMDFDPAQLRRVPAESVVHLYDVLRPGQLRGMPHLTQALIRLHELDKYDDATLLRQQLANMFVGFVTRPRPAVDETSVHPLSGQPIANLSGDPLQLGLEPGILQELDEGEDVKFSTPPGSGDYPTFMQQQLRAVGTATGVPYEVLTGDMRGVNDRTVRVLLHEFRRRLQALQHQNIAFQFCTPIWNAWVDRVFLSGALAIPVTYVERPSQWRDVRWTPQTWPYIHPVQDVEAQEAAVRNGFTSRSAVVSEQGEDAEDIDAQQAADNARADRLGVKYDSDARNAATYPPLPSEPQSGSEE